MSKKAQAKKNSADIERIRKEVRLAIAARLAALGSKAA